LNKIKKIKVKPLSSIQLDLSVNNVGLAAEPIIRKLPNREKYKCRIYELRPDVCRGYPKRNEKKRAAGHGCKGWDHINE